MPRRRTMVDETPARLSPLADFAYRALLVVFNLFLVIVWLPRVTMVSGDVGLGVVLLMAMVPLMLLAPKRARLDRHAESYRLTIFAGVGFVLFWGYLGVFRLDDPFRAGRLILSLGQGIILLFVISQVLSLRALRVSLALSGAMLVGISLLCLYNYLGGPPSTLTVLAHDRSSAFFKNPNQYGMILAMSVPFAVALYFRHGSKLLATILLVAIFLGLLLAASKTNLLLGLAWVLVTMSHGLIARGRIRTLLIALPVAVLVTVLGGLPLLELFNPRAASILEETVVGGDIGENTTIAQRTEMWQHSIGEMRRSPLFGQGTGQKIDTTSQLHSHSHNMFFDLGRTTGIPGLLGTLLFTLASCWLAIRTLLRVMAVPGRVAPYLPGNAIVVGASFAVLSYVLSNQMSDSFGPTTSVFFWLCLGLLLRRDELLFPDRPSVARAPAGLEERFAASA